MPRDEGGPVFAEPWQAQALEADLLFLTRAEKRLWCLRRHSLVSDRYDVGVFSFLVRSTARQGVAALAPVTGGVVERRRVRPAALGEGGLDQPFAQHQARQRVVALVAARLGVEPIGLVRL